MEGIVMACHIVEPMPGNVFIVNFKYSKFLAGFLLFAN